MCGTFSTSLAGKGKNVPLEQWEFDDYPVGDHHIRLYACRTACPFRYRTEGEYHWSPWTGVAYLLDSENHKLSEDGTPKTVICGVGRETRHTEGNCGAPVTEAIRNLHLRLGKLGIEL